MLDNISVQLYSARNFPPVATQLKTVADTGLHNVEFYAALLRDADQYTGDMQQHELVAPTTHVGLVDLQENFDTTVATAKTIGVRLMIIPFLMADNRPSDADGWTAFGAELGVQQARLAEHDLRLAWHNHDFEFRPTGDGRFPMDLILAGAPNLGWQMDIGWVVRAGQDPLAWIERYRDRIVSFHIKDLAPAGQNQDEDGWADVGHGTMDWAALLPAIRSAEPEFLVLEHDNPSDFARFMQRSVATMADW